MTPSQLSKWETGQIEPNTETQVSICEELDMLLDELVRGKRMRPMLIDLRDAERAIEREDVEYQKMATDLLLLVLAKARQDHRREKEKETR